MTVHIQHLSQADLSLQKKKDKTKKKKKKLQFFVNMDFSKLPVKAKRCN